MEITESESDKKDGSFYNDNVKAFSILTVFGILSFFYARLRFCEEKVLKSEQLEGPEKNFFPSEQRRQWNAFPSRGS